MEKQSAGRFQGLEGIRAYAFLLVFLVHYTTGLTDFAQNRGQYWLYPLVFLAQFSWMAVPIFFVLSGFLITGVLYDTRNRKGFFRVFYGRRALRILPLYYLVLIVTGLLAVLSHTRLHPSQLTYFFYVENLFYRRGADYSFGPYLTLTHLWSLAVEEQFYLSWPIVIWFLRKRTWLLTVSYTVIIAVFLLRIWWHVTKMPLEFAYLSTFTRCDALMIGAVMALHKRHIGFQFERLVRPAWVVLSVGLLVFLGKIVMQGNALPWDAVGLLLLTPLVNLMSAALVVLAIVPGNRVHSSCSQPWAVILGSKTYSLYVIHFVAIPFFLFYLPTFLTSRAGATGAKVISVGLCAGFTYLLASVTFRYLEQPAMRMKDRLPYGPVHEAPVEPVMMLIAKVRKLQARLRRPFVTMLLGETASGKVIDDVSGRNMNTVGQYRSGRP